MMSVNLLLFTVLKDLVQFIHKCQPKEERKLLQVYCCTLSSLWTRSISQVCPFVSYIHTFLS